MTARALSLSCVVLTMGDRPAELSRAVRSVLAQDGPPIEVLVLGNGADALAGVPADDPVRTAAHVRWEHLPENVGIPGGRNAGVRRAGGDAVLFLDDDGWFPDHALAEGVRRLLAADETLGILSFRVVDPVTGETARRHVPRLQAGDPLRPSDVTTFLGGACAVRRAVLERCGLFPDDFFYAHEETDLAWRALDAGYRIRYAAELVMHHPVLPPSRHATFYRLNARNRVWLARRRLPAPLVPVYLLTWIALTCARERRLPDLRVWFAGFLEGLREPAGRRRPIRWRTVARMTALGRPPVV